MWRIWLLFDPRRVFIGMFVWLFTMAILIHFILLSTDRFNWIEGPSAKPAAAAFQTLESNPTMAPKTPA
jgi:light-harvesting complex 1 alpha chain